MNFWDVLSEMLVILFGIGVGYAADRLGYLGDSVDNRLTGLIVNLTLPCMIMAAEMTSETLPSVREILSVLEVAAVYYALAFAFVLIAPRFLGGTAAQKGVWRFVLAFTNVGFIGYPVAVALFGPSALFYAAILAMPFNLLSFSLGPLMLGGGARFGWRQLCSPCIIASALSLVMALTRVQGPALLGQMMDFVGAVSIPLALMVVGSLLARIPGRQMLGTPRVWALTLLRLLVMPVILWVILRVIGVENPVLGIAVTQMGMPVAVSGTLLSVQYGGDTESMAQVTFLTTVISILTIPILAALLL